MKTFVRSFVALLLCAWLAPAALAGDDDEGKRPSTSQTMTIVGFAKDGKHFVLEVDDENRGLMYQVRSTKKNEIVEAFPFREETQKKAWRKVKKAVELADDWVDGPENPKKGVTMMTAQKDAFLCLFMMKGERIKLYSKIKLLETKKGEPAKSMVKQLAWDPKGKHAAIVYHQEITDLLGWKGDFVHSFKFKSYKASFDDEGEGEGGE